MIFIYGGMILLGLAAYVVDSPAIIALIYIYILATTVPALAVNCRIMHDVGKSGWYQLIPIYSLVLAVKEGDKGPNEYGADSKANTQEIKNIEIKDID